MSFGQQTEVKKSQSESQEWAVNSKGGNHHKA